MHRAIACWWPCASSAVAAHERHDRRARARARRLVPAIHRSARPVRRQSRPRRPAAQRYRASSSARATRSTQGSRARERHGAPRARTAGATVLAAVNADFFDLKTGENENNQVIAGEWWKGLKVTDSPYDTYDNVHVQFGIDARATAVDGSIHSRRQGVGRAASRRRSSPSTSIRRAIRKGRRSTRRASARRRRAIRRARRPRPR